jgi:hypothetical protein
MDVNKSSIAGPAFRASLVATAKTIGVLAAFIVSLMVAVNGGPIAVAVAAIFGALFIVVVVRRVNRRDDPRRAKLPPDAP